MEQWNKLVGLVKEFYIAFGQQEFLEKEMIDERMKLREKLFEEELKEYEVAEKIITRLKCWMQYATCVTYSSERCWKYIKAMLKL